MTTASDERQRNPARPAGPARAGGGVTVIGAATVLKGDLLGEEDLVVEGRVEGTVRLPGRRLTVASGGRVEGQLLAAEVVVEGEVEGDLVAEQRAVLRAAGRMRGDIKAPSAVLEEGCRFHGSVDMGGAETAGVERPPARPAQTALPAEVAAERPPAAGTPMP
ncbi:MAG TPA: polymer-forming cytoskeletal protein [Thermoanaerobaculia bacterium]|nr:polymer-forming cytoskeletal protein [Thermoanaerobaculia bacterium]